jgi:hypothetical protein
MTRRVGLILVCALPLLIAVQSASALDQKKCTEQFKAADLNNDGTLSRSEMGSAAKGMIPASLNNQNRISRKEYMSACAKVSANN